MNSKTEDTKELDTRTRTKQAAFQLLRDGIRPTVANVRRVTQKGSAKTINDALGEWWIELGTMLAMLQARPETPAPIYEIANVAWDAALQHARAELDQERKVLNDTAAAAKEDAKAARLAEQEANARVVLVNDKNQALHDANLNLERRLAAEAERRTHVEDRIRAIEAEMGRLRDENAQQAASYKEHLTKERERSDAIERRLFAQVDEYKTALEAVQASLKEQTSKWRAQEDSLNQALRTAREELVAKSAVVDSLRNQISGLDSSLRTATAEKDKSEKTVVVLQEQLRVAKENLALSRNKVSELKRQCSELTNRIHELDTAIAVLKAERDSNEK